MFDNKPPSPQYAAALAVPPISRTLEPVNVVVATPSLYPMVMFPVELSATNVVFLQFPPFALGSLTVM